MYTIKASGYIDGVKHNAVVVVDGKKHTFYMDDEENDIYDGTYQMYLETVKSVGAYHPPRWSVNNYFHSLRLMFDKGIADMECSIPLKQIRSSEDRIY